MHPLSSTHWSQERTPEPLQLDLQVSVSCPGWVLASRVSSHDWAASVLNCSSPIVALNIHIYLAANIFIYLAANAKTWSSWEGKATTIDIQTLWAPLRGKENSVILQFGVLKGRMGLPGYWDHQALPRALGVGRAQSYLRTHFPKAHLTVRLPCRIPQPVKWRRLVTSYPPI